MPELIGGDFEDLITRPQYPSSLRVKLPNWLDVICSTLVPASKRGLDLDDIGAKISQGFGCEWACDKLSQFQDL
jgi:hypothetical protein